MKVKLRFLLIPLVLVTIALVYLFISNNGPSVKIKNNKGASISYLSEVRGKPVIKVFNFDQEEVTKSYKIKNEQDLYSSTFYNINENKTSIITQQLEPYGYQVFIQTQNQLKKIGVIHEPIEEIVFADDHLYALTYSSDSDDVNLKKYKISDMEKPIETWSLKGNPKRMLIDENSKKIYVITVDQDTLLYSLDYKTDNFQYVKLLDKAFGLNATINNGQLWLLLQEQLEYPYDKLNSENKKSKTILQYDLEKQEIVNEINTEYQPRFIQFDDNQIYVISGTPNSSYLEYYDESNLKKTKDKTIKLEANTINGFVHEKYIFTNKGVYKIMDNKVELILEEQISSDIDLIIH